MKKQILTGLLSMAILGSALQPLHTANAKIPESSPTHPILSDCEYEEGTVLVTLAAPKKTSLVKEGITSFDENIKVEDSIHVGDATPLAENPKQETFLAEKELYVSEVSSSQYTTRELMNKLKNKAYIVSVEPNYRQYLTTTDPFAEKQWHLDGDDTFGTSPGIAYATARDKSRSNVPVVAVMDTGVNSSHEDLAAHMWQNTTETLDGTHGYNFVDDTTYCEDDNGHGTHCAGTIAAVRDNGMGITGISEARLMSLKVFSSDGYTDNATIIQALHYLLEAKRAGVNVTAVNCSWGGGTSNDTMASLINELGTMGVSFIFASGNDGLNHNENLGAICPYDMYDMIPTLRNYVIITGASNSNDHVACFSDYGSQDVDLFAPGEEILSTYHKINYLPGYYEDSVEEELTFRYLPMDDSSELDPLYHDKDLGISSRIQANISYEPDVNYASQISSGSLCWSLNFGNPTRSEKSSYLYLDVTDAGLNPEDTHFVSMFMGYENEYGEITWEHVVKESSGALGNEDNRFYESSDGHLYFRIIGMEANGQATGTSVYFLDNIGISTANPNPEALGQYEIMSGTSMAAPMVTGAVALLAERYPEDDSYNRKRRLLTCSRKTSATRTKCSTGGILDLTPMDTYVVTEAPPATTPKPTTPATSAPASTPAPVTPPNSFSVTISPTVTKVKKIKIKAKRKTVRAGKKLRLKAVITPSNAAKKKVRWSSSKKKWATVTQKGVVKAKKKGIGHTVKITAKAKDGSGKKATIKLRIKK